MKEYENEVQNTVTVKENQVFDKWNKRLQDYDN